MSRFALLLSVMQGERYAMLTQMFDEVRFARSIDPHGLPWLAAVPSLVISTNARLCGASFVQKVPGVLQQLRSATSEQLLRVLADPPGLFVCCFWLGRAVEHPNCAALHVCAFFCLSLFCLPLYRALLYCSLRFFLHFSLRFSLAEFIPWCAISCKSNHVALMLTLG